MSVAGTSGSTATPPKDLMPLLGQKGAPSKFTGRSSKVRRFLKHFNSLCNAYSVTTDADKCNKIVDYCSDSVNRVIESLDNFKADNWSELEKDLLNYFDADH